MSDPRDDRAFDRQQAAKAAETSGLRAVGVDYSTLRRRFSEAMCAEMAVEREMARLRRTQDEWTSHGIVLGIKHCIVKLDELCEETMGDG